jgi:hypothetical protein
MMHTAKIIEQDNEAFLNLPPEVLAYLKSKAGDNLKFVKTPDGVVIAPCTEEFAKAVKAGKQFMDKHPTAMQTLAKS